MYAEPRKLVTTKIGDTVVQKKASITIPDTVADKKFVDKTHYLQISKEHAPTYRITVSDNKLEH